MDAAAGSRTATTVSSYVEELIYTSAPKLLQPAKSHLGVVAATENFSPDVQRQLGALWSYEVPSELNLLASQKTPRFVLMPVQSHRPLTSLSRIQSAGFDHTGRTNPIAHHFVVDCDSLVKNDLSVADLAVWASGHYLGVDGKPEFCDRWVGDPRYCPTRILKRQDPPRSPFELIEPISSASGISCQVLSQGMLAAADAMLKYQAQQRMLVFVIRPTAASYVLGILAAILTALPKRIQSRVSAISHVWEISDAPFGYALSFTYPRSPYLERIKTRMDAKKPIILDLAAKPCVIPTLSSEYISFVERDQGHWKSTTNPPTPVLFDRVDPAVEQSTAVYKLKSALEDRRRESGLSSLRVVVSRASDGTKLGLSVEGIEELIGCVGKDTILKCVAAKRWPELFETWGDSIIPSAIRDYAESQVAKNFQIILQESIDLVAEQSCGSLGDKIVALIKMHVPFVGPVFRQVLQIAATFPDSKRLSIASTWAMVGTPILEVAWACTLENIQQESKATSVCRQILTQLIPIAVFREESDVFSSEHTSEYQGFEEILQSSWRLFEKRLHFGQSPPELCCQLLTKLVPKAIALP